MVIKINKFYFLLFLFFTPIISSEKKIMVHGCLGDGFFAEFFWVLNFLDFSIKADKIPIVYWDEKSPYYNKDGFNGKLNAWEYYFEQVSNLSYSKELEVSFKHSYDMSLESIFWDYSEIIKYKLMHSDQAIFKSISFQAIPQYGTFTKGQYHIYEEVRREKIKKNILNKFIKIRRPVEEKIDVFYLEKMKNKRTIGIHLRGQHVCGSVPIVPISFILEEANKKANPDTQFFVSTDQQALLNQAIKELKGTVIYYPLERFAAPSAPFPGEKVSPEAGEGVLIEAILLSRCDFFIHTLSHVSTAVLHFNPRLKHLLLY